MNVALIIPLYDQSQNWSKILKAIESQTVLPNTTFLLCDRPTATDIDTIKGINAKSKLDIKLISVTSPPNIQKEENIFLTPYVRNIGINHALNDNCDKFIFIDGDCVPQHRLIESHIQKLKNKMPVLSVGRRRELCYRWQDRREYVPELLHLDLFRKNGLLINKNY